MKSVTRFLFCAPSAIALAFAQFSDGAVTTQATPVSAEQRDFFENKIRPILSNSCLECHSAEKGKVKGGLNLDSREALLKGGESGPGFKLGDVKGSVIIKAVTWEDDLQMPPKKKLSDEEIESLKKWIGMGAPDPRDPSKVVVKDKKDHWAFQPVARPEPPAVKNAAWCKNSIDRFVLAKLESKQMMPAAQSPKEALLRRAYFDLIGLPPSPKEIEAFVRDPNPDEAYARVIDKLLADPAHGERWARHWLDTARYSDTTGFVGNNRFEDFRYAYAYSYRDWVINAINRDMPYDQFIINQLAADKVPENSKENLAALGFLTVGQRFAQKDDIINDRIDVIGRGMLGLTISCARCHDHKFDPVTAADYYALRGVFDSISEPKEGPIVAGGNPNSASLQEFNRRLAELEKSAFNTFYLMQREISDRARKNAEQIFEIALLSGRDATADQKKAGNELLLKAKLDANFVDDTFRLMTRQASIYGVFNKLATLKEGDKQLTDILEGKAEVRRGVKYNPLVIEFLKKQPKLPSSIHDVSVLFGKMLLEIEPKVASLYAEMANPSMSYANSPRKAELELAAFPIPVGPASDLNLDRLRSEGKSWGLRFGGQLENRSGLAKINELKLTSKEGPVRAMVVEDLPKPKDSPLFVRGNAPKPGEQARIIPRRFIEVLSTNGQPTPFKMGSGRLELARAIASKDNPLTARVLVNRVWMYHFGEGLVRTPDDLGNQAGQPSHPELLDFLTSWFLEDFGPSKPAWSVKALHKAVMLSKAYQQSSNTAFKGNGSDSADYEKVDPANNFLWHSNLRRLDFEAFRDSLLAMAGSLDRSTIGGPSVNITEEPYSYRRSVYGYIDRSNVSDLLMQFDMSNPDQPNTKRTSTIVPQQALFLMNSPFVAQVVQKVVNRPEVVEAVRKDTRSGIVAVFRVVLQRTPTREEQEMAINFLVKENKHQAEVKAASAELNKEGARMASEKLRRLQNNNGDKKEVVNDEELKGPSVTLTKGSPVVTKVMNANELRVGALVSGAGVPPNTSIVAISGSSVTLSNPAQASSSNARLLVAELVKRVAFSPWEALVQAIMFSNEAAYVN